MESHEWLIQMLFTVLCFYILYIYIDLRITNLKLLTQNNIPSYQENLHGLEMINLRNTHPIYPEPSICDHLPL